MYALKIYKRYEVLKPIEAKIGPAAQVPEFGASDGATQYLFDQSIEKLVKQGILRETMEENWGQVSTFDRSKFYANRMESHLKL